MDTSPKKELLRFLSEDIRSGDITSALLAKKKIEAKIISRQQGVIAGVKFAKNLFQLKGCTVKSFVKDGARIKPNQKILQVSGSTQSVLSCERTALNLLSRMSGIATQTSFLVSKIRKVSRRTNLYSTRKTSVRIIADPNTNKNTHQINANGNFGNLSFTIENIPDSTNPKTSRLATLSAIELVRQICTKEVKIGT